MRSQVGGIVNVSNKSNGTGGNYTGNYTGAEGGGGGGVIPGPEDFFFFWLDMLIEFSIAVYVELLKLLRRLLGTPYPKNSGWMGVFGEPTGPFRPLYQDVLLAYVFPILATLIVFTLVAYFISIVLGSIFGRYKAGQYLFTFIVGVLIVSFSWTAVTYLQKVTHVVTMGLLPTAGELTSGAAQTLVTLGGQVAILGSMALLGASQSLLLVAIYGARQAILFYAPFIFPILVYMAFLGPHDYIKAIGSLAIWQYFAVLAYPLPTAIGLRMAYEMNWAFSHNGLENAILTIGLVATMVVWPIFSSASLFFVPLLLRIFSVRSGSGDSGDHQDSGDSGSDSGGDSGTEYGSEPSGSSTESNPNHQTHDPGMTASSSQQSHREVAADGGVSSPLGSTSAEEIRSDYNSNRHKRTRNREWSQ